MGTHQFEGPGQSDEAESLNTRRQRLAYAALELRSVVAELVSSGAAQDGYTRTPELLHAQEVGEQLKGEPIRGILTGKRYYLDGQPAGYLSAAHYLPRGFTNPPTVLGIFEGAIKMHKVQENAELMIGISPLGSSDNEDIKAHYKDSWLAQNRWHQPLGLRKQDLDQRLWLPAVDFDIAGWNQEDDYLEKDILRAEGLRAYFRQKFPPEQPPAE